MSLNTYISIINVLIYGYDVVQEQLKRTWHNRAVVISKNKSGESRVGAFQLKFRKILVFSKLGYGHFANVYDLANVLVVLLEKSEEEIGKLKARLAKEDLYSYLRKRIKSVKMSVKAIMVQINRLIIEGNTEVSIERLKFACNQMSKEPEAQSNLLSEIKIRPKTMRQISSKNWIKYKQTPPQNKSSHGSQKQNSSLKTTKDFQQQQSQQTLIARSSKYKNNRKISRSSLMQSRFANKNMIKISNLGQQGQEQHVQKYQYLSKEMDQCGGSLEEDEEVEFQLLELSDEGDGNGNGEKEGEISEEKVMQRKIEEGFNFKLTANYTEQKNSRKYSFQYKKFAQMLQIELQQQQQSKKKSPLFEESKQKDRNDSSSSSETEEQPNLYEIDKRDLMSRRDLWVETNQNQLYEEQEDMLGNLDGVQGQNSEEVMGRVGKVAAVAQENQSTINVRESMECSRKTYKKIVTQQQPMPSKSLTVIKNYQQGFKLIRIQNIADRRPQKQILIHVQDIPKLYPLIQIIMYLHKTYPSYFVQVLHCTNMQSIKLFPFSSLNLVTLFNPILGVFETYDLKIELTGAHQEDIPAWGIVICQAVLQVLPLPIKEDQLGKILRVLTGVPVVHVNGVDLRKFKRIIVEGYFQDPKGRNGKALCCKEMGENGQFQYCQLMEFQKDKDFLQSKVKYVEYPSLSWTQNKIYQQFVLQYQNWLLFLYKNNYYHNQKTQKLIPNTNLKSWHMEINLQKETELFLQFSEHERLEKSNQITVCKLTQNEVEAIGELRKKGNFFFQLSLESGKYLITISRSVDQEQTNSIHFYSSNPVNIVESSIRQQQE